MLFNVKRRGKIRAGGYVDYTMLRHKNCSGKIEEKSQPMRNFRANAATNVLLECQKCRRELILDHIDNETEREWNKHLYIPESLDLESTKLEPVARLITKKAGSGEYTTLVDLTEKELVEYYSDLYKRHRWHGPQPEPMVGFNG
jgi:hypothetical protein